MLKEEIIRKSKLAWTVPILLVDKSNKKVKYCVNYRKFNEIIKIFISCQELIIFLIN
jgi:hypothetical protein